MRRLQRQLRHIYCIPLILWLLLKLSSHQYWTIWALVVHGIFGSCVKISCAFALKISLVRMAFIFSSAYAKDIKRLRGQDNRLGTVV